MRTQQADPGQAGQGAGPAAVGPGQAEVPHPGLPDFPTQSLSPSCMCMPVSTLSLPGALQACTVQRPCHLRS